ncbi:hypothetical protein Tco_0576019 [Tanacetum coccineum]
MHTFQQPLIYTKKWTKDHPFTTIIGDPSKPVSTRRQLSTDALWCYFHTFLAKEESKNYKEAMIESSWIKAMQEEIHEYEWLEVWELEEGVDFEESFAHVARIKAIRIFLAYAAHKNMLKIVKAVVDLTLFTRKEGNELILNGLDQCDAVDIPMVGQSKLNEDPNRTSIDPTRYRGMVGSLMYLTASRPDLVFVVCMCAWLPRYKTQYIGKCKVPRRKPCQLVIQETELTDYGFNFNKIPLYSDLKSSIALSCYTMQHSRMKHITVRYHFIKEHVEYEIVELYFVKTDYQPGDIFTKALARECFEFLINRLGMQSITHEELKHLVESDEE